MSTAGLDEAALLSYLTRNFGADVTFASPPRALSQGTGSSVYLFELAGAPAQVWGGPLVLRLIALHHGSAWIEREAAIHRFVVERGYPSPRLLAVEAGGDVLGMPFTIMERAPGTNLDRLLRGGGPLQAYRLATAFADLHVDLHRLPLEGYPERVEGWSGARRLALYRDGRLAVSPEQGADLAWLEARQDAVLPEELSICHNNYHPVNVIVDRDDRMRVIDWSNADLGDRQGDVADALVLLRTQAARGRGLRGAAERVARAVFLGRYLRRYEQQLPLDRARLRYWEALSAFAHQGFLSALQPAAANAEHIEAQRRRLARYFRDRQREIGV